MATEDQIALYLLAITQAQGEYGHRVARAMRLGKTNNKLNLTKLTLLGYYVKMMEKYFFTDDYTVNNFCTVDEAKEIMRRINEISSIFVSIKL